MSERTLVNACLISTPFALVSSAYVLHSPWRIAVSWGCALIAAFILGVRYANRPSSPEKEG